MQYTPVVKQLDFNNLASEITPQFPHIFPLKFADYSHRQHYLYSLHLYTFIWCSSSLLSLFFFSLFASIFSKATYHSHDFEDEVYLS
jgi:hypothetical protein